MASGPASSQVPYEPLSLVTDEKTSTSTSPGLTDSRISQSPSSRDLIAEDVNPTPAVDLVAGGRFLGGALFSDQPDLRNSYVSSQSSSPAPPSIYNSVYALNTSSGGPSNQPGQTGTAYLSSADENRLSEEKNTVSQETPKRRTRSFWIMTVLAGLSILLLVTAVLVYFLVIKPKSQTSSSSKTTTATSAKAPTSTSKPKTSGVITGGDGSVVTTEDGSTFVYRNSFKGYWYYDENDPFNNGARAQSWSPALNETFRYGIDPIRG